jgi:hypothetical protein
MLVGCLAVAGAFGLFVYASNNQSQLRYFKRHHPGISLVLILFMGYIIIYFLGSVLIFIFGIAVPIAGIYCYIKYRTLLNGGIHFLLEEKICNSLSKWFYCS